jgi:hypothetical protein
VEEGGCEQAGWASRLHREGREGAGPALRVGPGQGQVGPAGREEWRGREKFGPREEKDFPFSIRHRGMKTKEFGEGFKKRSDIIQWSLRRTPTKKLRTDSLRLRDRLNEDSGRLCYGFVHSKRNSKP